MGAAMAQQYGTLDERLCCARPYARALCALSQEPQALIDQAQTLGRIYAHPVAAAYLRSARYAWSDKAALLEACGVSRIFIACLKEVDKVGKIGVIPELCRHIVSYGEQACGYRSGLVESVVPLTEAMHADIEAYCGRLLGHTLRLQWRCNPDLIGGFRVQVGDCVWEKSLRSFVQAQRRAFHQGRDIGINVTHENREA
jgi:F0F1-type ATP synthase delta subunit